MFKINNKIYENELIEVSLGQFDLSYMDEGIRKNKSGSAPYFHIEITNETNDKIWLGIETTICDNELKDLKIDKEIDMKKHITDIIYSVNGSFDNVYDENFTSSIKKIKNNIFKFKIDYRPLYIEIDCNIVIDFKD